MILAFRLESSSLRFYSSMKVCQVQVSPFDVLLDLLSDPDGDVRKKVVSALGYLGDTSPHVIDALLTALSDENAQVARTAINAIGRLGARQPRIIDALLTTKFSPTMEAAIKALWRLDASHA
jgi:HEAT repeat protein